MFNFSVKSYSMEIFFRHVVNDPRRQVPSLALFMGSCLTDGPLSVIEALCAVLMAINS